MWSYLSLLLLLAWAALCAVGDARYKRIDNRLVLVGAVVSILSLLVWQRSLTGATPGETLLSCALALLFALPGYWTRRFGAGDVKLLLVLALASDSMYLLFSLAGATLGIVLWLLTAPALWPRLPPAWHRAMPMLAPPAKVLPYAPFVLFGMLLATLAR